MGLPFLDEEIFIWKYWGISSPENQVSLKKIPLILLLITDKLLFYIDKNLNLFFVLCSFYRFEFFFQQSCEKKRI